MCDWNRPSGSGRVIGAALLAAGVILLMIAIPCRFWTAALGVALIAAGVALLRQG